MSGRKRKNYDPSDPRNWPKERYIEKLKNMGIGINTSWKVEVLRQLYLANLPNNTQTSSDQEEEINVVQHTPENVQVTSLPAVTTAVSSALDRQRPVLTSAAAEGFSSLGSESMINNTSNLRNVNNEALLRETTCALRSATETLSSISKIMLNQSNNTVEIDKGVYTLASAVKAMNGDEDLRAVNTTGVVLQQQVLSHQKAVYSEDLPKMDFVAPAVKKQILEGKDVNLTILLSSKYDLPQQHTMQSGGLTVELNTKKILDSGIIYRWKNLIGPFENIEISCAKHIRTERQN